MSKKGNPNQLIQNEDSKSIFQILLDAKNAEMKCMVWKMVGSSKITAECYIQVIRKFNNEMVLKAQTAGQDEKLRTIISGSDSVNVYIIEKAVLFRSKVRVIDDAGDLAIQFPEMLAQAERRKTLRLIVPYEVNCDVAFFKTSLDRGTQTQIFEKKCYDISAGGMSFLLNKAESKFFEIGDMITSLKIVIDGYELMVDGRIVNFIPVEPGPNNDVIYKGLRVCLKFESVDEITKDTLNEFVFKHLDLGIDQVRPIA